VTCLLLYLLLLRVDFELVKELTLQADLQVLAAAFALFLSRNLLAALRWQVLLAEKEQLVPLTSLFRFYLIGNFFGLFLPTAIGGDVARGYYVHKAGVSKEESASSIVVERTLGIAAMMIYALASMFFSFNLIDNELKLVVIIPSIFFLTVMFLFYRNEITPKTKLSKFAGPKLSMLLKLVKSIQQYKSPTALLTSFLYSALYQLTGIISIYLIALSVGSALKFAYFLMLLPIVWVVSMIPISLNGLGIREGAFVFLFTSAGMAKETAVIISSISLLQAIAQGMIGGILFLCDRQKVAAIKQYSHLS
jgi:uncharacterized protein (TIRG00374 family)